MVAARILAVTFALLLGASITLDEGSTPVAVEGFLPPDLEHSSMLACLVGAPEKGLLHVKVQVEYAGSRRAPYLALIAVEVDIHKAISDCKEWWERVDKAMYATK